jgi:hypothetical protein
MEYQWNSLMDNGNSWTLDDGSFLLFYVKPGESSMNKTSPFDPKMMDAGERKQATITMFATFSILNMTIAADTYAHLKGMFIAVGLTFSGRRRKRGQGKCFFSFGSMMLVLISFAQVLICAAI